MSGTALRERVRPERVLAELRELAALTSDEHGAQRVCWTPVWQAALEWFRERAHGCGLESRADAAGNVWAVRPGRNEGVVVVGSHLDSVPNGGWLDGAYGTLTGLEILRAAGEGPPTEDTLAVVAFADEEGARFGPSLGSAGAVGRADAAWGDLRDRDGVSLTEAAASCGIDVERANEAAAGFDRVRAYVEIHVEQGPVLEERGIPLGVVTGTVAMQRERLRLRGIANHAAATPMPLRRDALAAAAEAIVAVRTAALTVGGSTGTASEIHVGPNVWSVIADDVELVVDMRAPSETAVAQMFERVRASVEVAAAANGVEHAWDFVRGHGAQPFDARLIELAHAACRDVGAEAPEMLSGAMHDATVIASRLPASLLFVPSIGGVSHSATEDTRESDLATGVRALAALVDRITG